MESEGGVVNGESDWFGPDGEERPGHGPASRPGGWSAEGPLRHAARTLAERSYLNGLERAQREAWERASGSHPQLSPKRLLVALSHTIEKAVMSGPIEAPTVVIALFQRLEFFDREREVYQRMADAGIEVVVGFVEGEQHDAPANVHMVLLGVEEPLADEWTVVAVGPRAGAFLVATDQHHFDGHERVAELGREFAGRWGYSRAQAGTELARLRFALGERLDPGLRTRIDALLADTMPPGGSPAASAGTPGETWATTSLFHLIESMQTARAGNRELREQLADAHRAVAAAVNASTDPRSGLPTAEFLERWESPDGAAVPVGLALFDIPALAGAASSADPRATYYAAHHAAAALTQPLGPVDAVVHLSDGEFLVIVPGASSRHLAELCDDIGEQLELASDGYPHVPLRAAVATIVTRTRPLPLRDLREATGRLRGQAGPLDAGLTPHGDRIVVSTTALQAAGAAPAAPAPEPAGNGRPDQQAAEEPPAETAAAEGEIARAAS